MPRSRFGRWLPVAGLCICVGMVAASSWIVLRKIKDLSTANTDNLQWTLSQGDVEFLRFKVVLQQARASPERLDDLRRRFDIFYSRMITFGNGRILAPLRARPGFGEHWSQVLGFLESAAPLVDAPDETLAQALPRLSAAAEAVEADVRALTLLGLSTFAEESDDLRTQLVETLVIMTLVLALLVASLVLFALKYRKLASVADDRAAEVQTKAARMRTIVETSLDAIIVTDFAGRVRSCNTVAARMFGHGEEGLADRDLAELIAPEGEADALRDGHLAFLAAGRDPGEDEKRFEIAVADSEGRTFPAEVSINRADPGRDRIVVAYLRDISLRKEAEAELTGARDRALAGEKAKAEFLAIASHEMRTPLNGMLGTMELMRDGALDPRQRELLDRMQTSGGILLDLANDVLDLARLESGKLVAERQPFSVTDLVESVLETTEPIAKKSGNEVSWSWTGPPRDHVIGDARRLRQVLLNFVGNALKFTGNGSIRIEATLGGDRGDEVEFSVTDTGIGIDPDDLGRVFNDFETLDSSYARRSQGAGLGLGIAKRLAGLMDGSIGAGSSPGQGSRFWIRLPLPAAGGSAEDEVAADARGAPAAEPLDLLVVEDNELNRFILRGFLERAGHRVTEASDGRSGVTLAQTHGFDAILMDVSMPVMDGMEASRAIRRNAGASASAPIIGVTAHALPEETKRFRESGMTACLSKPVDRAALLSILGNVTGRRNSPSAEPAGHGTPTLLDPAIVAEIADVLKGDTSIVRKLAEDADRDISRLEKMAPSDPDLARIAHRCAGVVGNFGLSKLSRSLLDIERMCKVGGTPDPAALKALGPLWSESRDALAAHLRLLPGPAWHEGAPGAAAPTSPPRDEGPISPA